MYYVSQEENLFQRQLISFEKKATQSDLAKKDQIFLNLPTSRDAKARIFDVAFQISVVAKGAKKHYVNPED